MALSVKSSSISFLEWDLFKQENKNYFRDSSSHMHGIARWHVDHVNECLPFAHIALSHSHARLCPPPRFHSFSFVAFIIAIQVDVLVYSFIRMNDYKFTCSAFQPVHCTMSASFGTLGSNSFECIDSNITNNENEWRNSQVQ